MFKSFKLPALLFAAISLSGAVTAQVTFNSEAGEAAATQNIIIKKKDSTKEKITVVIDGNNVTVNGKPVKDFESDDIDIIQQKIKDGDYYVYGYGTPSPAIAPLPPNARTFSRDLNRTIKTNGAFLGVMSEKVNEGAKITDVTEESAAEKAGLKEDDIITKIGDDKITDPDALYKAVGKHKPDEKVTITYLRDGKTATTTATLGKSEQARVFSWNSPNTDVDVFKNFNAPHNFSFSWNDKPRLGLSVQDTEEGNGVKVVDIDDEDSPAAKAGLKEDDIITQINGKTVTSTDGLRELTSALKKGDTVKVTYKRNNQTQTVDVKLPKELKTVDL